MTTLKFTALTDKKVLTLCLVTMLALGLRIYALNSRSLWFDEAMEYWVATSSLEELPESVREGIQDPPLFSFLLHFWMKLGNSEFHLRLISVFFSCLSVVGIMACSFQMTGYAGGLIAGILMTLLPSQIRYAQEVGQYALMICLVSWCVFVLFRLINGAGRRWYLTWVILALLATYTYYGAFISLVSSFLVVFIKDLKQRDWDAVKKDVAAVSSYALGILPLLIYFLPQQLFRGPIDSTLQLELLAPIQEIIGFLSSAGQLIAFQFTGWPWTVVPLGITLALVGLVLVFNFAPKAKNVAWMMLCLALAWVIYYIVAKVGLYPWGFRYSLILAPLLILVVSHGIAVSLSRLRFQFIGISFLLAIIAISLLALPFTSIREILEDGADWAWPEQEELRPVIGFWYENRMMADHTYVYYGAIPAFAYYLEQNQGNQLALPPTWYVGCLRGDPIPYCRMDDITYGGWLRNLATENKLEAIRDLVPEDAERVWLVFSHIYPDEDIQILEGLLRDYSMVLHYEKKNASIYLLKQN